MLRSQLNVKSLNLTLFCIIYSCFSSCSAQTSKKMPHNIISVESIMSGNTGFRGRLMPEDMNKSNSGVEYLEFEFKAKSKCTIDSVYLIFKDNKQRVLLKNDALPKMLRKNETWVWRVENISSQYERANGELSQHKVTYVEIYMKGKKELSTFSNITRVLPN